jgi:hypothetical protein
MKPEAAHSPARRGSRRLILVIVVLLAIGGTALAFVWNYAYPSHRPGAAVVFHLDRRAPLLSSSRGEVERNDFDEYRQSQIALVRSRRVINTALNDSGVKETELIREADPDAVNWLEANLRVSSDPSSSLIRVELDGENSAEVLIVLSAVSKAYLSVTLERDNSATSRRLHELQQASNECERDVQRARSMLSRLEEMSGGGSYSVLLHNRSEAEIAEEVKTARDELRRVRLERALLEANPPPANDLPSPPRIAVGGGAIVAGDAGKVTISRSRAEALKVLAVREQFWINETKDAQESLAMRSRHTAEMHKLKSQIEPKAELFKRLEDEIERCKLELRAAPRVSMADEPFERPRHR